MKFSDIPGLNNLKHILTRSVDEGHVAHAQLFLGAEGALNLPLALAYTTYLHCQNKQSGESCGQCAACNKSLKYIHPDTHFVFPLSNVIKEKDNEQLKADVLKLWRSFILEKPYADENDWLTYYGGEDKQPNISKETARDIIKSLTLKPFESNYKVMIIWMPEYMHPAAANALLKILEEPAPQTVFLLITNHAEKLLSTITSRTQIISIPQLDDAELEKYLSEKLQLEQNKISSVLPIADGSIIKALRLIDNTEDGNLEIFTEWMRSCFKMDYQKMLGFSEQFHENDKLAQRNFFQFCLHMLRESVVQLSGATTSRMRGEDLDFINKFSSVMNLQRVEHMYKLINEASYHLERNGSPKMIFLDLSLQISGKLKTQ
jgi:DNA polymerase III subunit delta'